jgi:hypothetical protein
MNYVEITGQSEPNFYSETCRDAFWKKYMFCCDWRVISILYRQTVSRTQCQVDVCRTAATAWYNKQVVVTVWSARFVCVPIFYKKLFTCNNGIKQCRCRSVGHEASYLRLPTWGFLLEAFPNINFTLTLVDLQLDAQNSYLFTYNTFIKIICMFRALPC